jgi:hypothetical protein
LSVELSNRSLQKDDKYLPAYTSFYHGRMIFIFASLELQISRSVARTLDIRLLICYVKRIVFLGDASLLFPPADLIDIMHLLRALVSTYGSYAR